MRNSRFGRSSRSSSSISRSMMGRSIGLPIGRATSPWASAKASRARSSASRRSASAVLTLSRYSWTTSTAGPWTWSTPWSSQAAWSHMLRTRLRLWVTITMVTPLERSL